MCEGTAYRRCIIEVDNFKINLLKLFKVAMIFFINIDRLNIIDYFYPTHECFNSEKLLSLLQTTIQRTRKNNFI